MDYPNDTYKSISEVSEGLYKDKGSRFISFAFPVKSEEQIKEIMHELKKKYYDARHHCYAYVLGIEKNTYRIYDDGEPSGTAGKPIYGQIQAHGLTNVLVVVIRYFGGIKLGVRGLINAYKGAAQDALNNASIVTLVEESGFRIFFDYKQMNEVMRIFKDNKLDTYGHQFELNCSLVFSVRNKLKDKVLFELSKVSNLHIGNL
jgi:uncharacterized YigZ family protein